VDAVAVEDQGAVPGGGEATTHRSDCMHEEAAGAPHCRCDVTSDSKIARAIDATHLANRSFHQITQELNVDDGRIATIGPL
jgi:hypothetical protein